MLLQIRLSVRMSVTRVYHCEVSLMQFLPYGSPIPLLFGDKFHPEIPTGSLQMGALKQVWTVGWGNLLFS